tara:strand:+ start:2514 stop:2660 length:147 start_codon:yes stop_codon:yes gene_type:complete
MYQLHFNVNGNNHLENTNSKKSAIQRLIYEFKNVKPAFQKVKSKVSKH